MPGKPGFYGKRRSTGAMASKGRVFVCCECGELSYRWLGRCPGCGAYGSMEERREEPRRGGGERRGAGDPRPIPLHAPVGGEARMTSGIGELDRVLGGGAVAGSLVLVGGEPGIGKSTLLLQAGAGWASRGTRTLLVSGEESAAQVGSRAARLGISHPDLLLLCEGELEVLERAARELAPGVMVVDSLQTVWVPGLDSPPGGVGQMRESVFRLQRLAKELEAAVFLVGHVTKDGVVAGPRLVEHMVDCVLYFEGDRSDGLRILRSVKNRFGSTSEVGIFEMTDGGLREVEDPSLRFVGRRKKPVPGTASGVVLEGRRPLVVEVQALVAPSCLPSPKRISSGVDPRRLAVNIAVLERRAGLRLSDRDIYVGLTGGLRISEPCLDLAMCMAVASSHLDRPVPPGSAMLGEVSLTGEVHPVSRMADRIREAYRLGYGKLFLSSSFLEKADEAGLAGGMELVGVGDIEEALRAAGLIHPSSRS